MGAVEEELGKFMSAVRPETVALDSLVALRLAAGDDQWNLAALTRLVDTAIAGLEPADFKTAAEHLLGSEKRAGRNLAARSSDAAEAFGVGYDAFRRRGADGRSHRDRVVRSVAEAIVAQAPNRIVTAPVTADPSPDPDGNRSRRTAVWGGVLVAVVAMVLVGAFALAGDDGSDADRAAVLLGPLDVTLHCRTVHGIGATSTVVGDDPDGWRCRVNGENVSVDLNEACKSQYGAASRPDSSAGTDAYGWRCAIEAAGDDGQCAVAAGQFDPSLSSSFAELSRDFRTVADARLENPEACPATFMHRWSIGVIQEFVLDGDIVGALLWAPGGDVTMLQGTAWTALERVLGLDADIVGFPTGPAVETSEGHTAVALTSGAQLVASGDQDTFYLVPEVSLTAWLDLGGSQGCLGLPASDPFPVGAGFRQDFFAGALVLNLLTGEIDIVDSETC